MLKMRHLKAFIDGWITKNGRVKKNTHIKLHTIFRILGIKQKTKNEKNNIKRPIDMKNVEKRKKRGKKNQSLFYDLFSISYAS